MKKVLAAMVAMFVLTIPMAGLWIVLLKPLVGGGAEQTFFYPIYAGMILLAGIVVGCTVVIVEEIRSLKNDKKEEK